MELKNVTHFIITETQATVEMQGPPKGTLGNGLGSLSGKFLLDGFSCVCDYNETRNQIKPAIDTVSAIQINQRQSM